MYMITHKTTGNLMYISNFNCNGVECGTTPIFKTAEEADKFIKETGGEDHWEVVTPTDYKRAGEERG